MNKFAGRKIIVTGASQGLGAVAAAAYANAGASVALIGRQIEKIKVLASTLVNPSNHCAIQVDLFDTGSLTDGVNRAVAHLGGVDAVLHSAGGGLGLHAPLLPGTELMKLFHLNVVAPAEINRIVVPVMKAAGGGNLVHVGSIASYEAVASVGYNTAKAGLAAYVRSLGRELAPENIVVTGIMPGGFHGPDNAMTRLQSSKPEVYNAIVENRLPRKKMGDAQELVPLLLLLASSDASMMGGCMVPVDAAEGKSYQIE